MEIKIYNRFHNYLDTLNEFGDVNTTNTFNGVNKATFTVPINSQKATVTLMEFGNHVEIIKNGKILWYGLIVDRTFNGAVIEIGCYGYLYLLSKRRLYDNTFTDKTYGEIITSILSYVNSRDNTYITIGNLASSTTTTRIINVDDMCLDKIYQYTNDINYLVEVDENLKLNLISSRQAPFKYVFQYNSHDDFNNIIKMPRLNQSEIDMVNSWYGSIENQDGSSYDKSVSNIDSISKYGLKENVLNINKGVVDALTVERNLTSELKKTEWILSQVDVEVCDSDLAPIDYLKVGETVKLIIEPYFNLNIELPILEITIDHSSRKAKVVLGHFLQRNLSPITKIYKGGLV